MKYLISEPQGVISKEIGATTFEIETKVAEDGRVSLMIEEREYVPAVSNSTFPSQEAADRYIRTIGQIMKVTR